MTLEGVEDLIFPISSLSLSLSLCVISISAFALRDRSWPPPFTDRKSTLFNTNGGRANKDEDPQIFERDV